MQMQISELSHLVPSQICVFISPLHQKGVNLLSTLIKKLPHVEKLGGRPGKRGSILLMYTCTFSLAVFPQVGGGLCDIPIT